MTSHRAPKESHSEGHTARSAVRALLGMSMMTTSVVASTPASAAPDTNAGNVVDTDQVRVLSKLSRSVDAATQHALSTEHMRTIQDMLDTWVIADVVQAKSWNEATLRQQLAYIAQKISYEERIASGDRSVSLSLILKSVAPEGDNMRIHMVAVWDSRTSEYITYQTTAVRSAAQAHQDAAPDMALQLHNTVAGNEYDPLVQPATRNFTPQQIETFRHELTEFLGSLRTDSLDQLQYHDKDPIPYSDDPHVMSGPKGPQFFALPHSDKFLVEFGDALDGRTQLQRGMDRAAFRQSGERAPDSWERTQIMFKLRFIFGRSNDRPRGQKRSPQRNKKHKRPYV